MFAVLIQCDPPPVSPPPDAPPSNAAGWFVLALALAVIVFDVWALKTKRPTVSQWIKRRVRGRSWWGWIGAALFGGVLWHVLFGGPL